MARLQHDLDAFRAAVLRRGPLCVLVLLLLLAEGWAHSAQARARPRVEHATGSAAGERIYREGVLPTGNELIGERTSGLPVQAESAACVNCHRRSGLGELEGRLLVPPVTGRYLYRPRSRAWPSNLESVALIRAEPGSLPELLPESERSAYTDATLARAIRDGIGPDGRALGDLMPRYRIGDADMASLIGYLKQLSNRPSPGVGDDTLQFATVITPDADPTRRRGMLDVLEKFFGKENVFRSGESPPPQLARRFVASAHRRQLHVWELAGAPQTWEAQLDQRLQREPVFALISGVGGRTWEPVHRFCQRTAIPCILPNVDLPVLGAADEYDIYFSKGVLLEAELAAGRLRDDAPDATAGRRRVIQIYREGDIGQAAAAHLRSLLAGSSLESVERALASTAGPAELAAALATADGDSVMLWLRPDDLKRLPSEPPAAKSVFVSGTMGGLENAPLDAGWRRAVRMAYPFDLPEARHARLNYPLGWMHLKKVPVVDERVQADTYLACLVIAETVGMLREDLVRDHLVEMLEMHLGTYLLTGYYPRLGLAPTDRFASKGGYVVRFPDATGRRVVADSEWSVP